MFNISIILQGGLGNRLFQISSLIFKYYFNLKLKNNY